MSVWIIRQEFTPEQEQNLAEQTHITLPFAELPDLAGVDSEQAMRRLLAAIRPELPPETIARQAEVYWKHYSEMAVEDFILVPLAHSKYFALAEVTKRYEHRVEEGRDVHRVEVRWLNVAIHPLKLRHLGPLLKNASVMQQMPHADQRKQVYALLERPYNRFRKVQWLMAAIIVLAEIAWLARMIEH